MDQKLIILAAELGKKLQQQTLTLAVAESCTGGGISQVITEIAGSSHWFDRGFITYSNRAKIDMLGVSETTLNQSGAVSEETALEMVAGVLKYSPVDWAISVTGVAGPDGGSEEKPVGTVFIAWQTKTTDPLVKHYLFKGDRHQIRQQVIVKALEGVCC
ncbi:MAG: CinA family protein [Methylococcales bacterium]|nr:CinA family protein [Methylococcales bacterium]